MSEALRDIGEVGAGEISRRCRGISRSTVDRQRWRPRLTRFSIFLAGCGTTASACSGQLVDVTAIDRLGRERRFDVIYNLLSLRHNLRLRIRVAVGEETPVPSCFTVFSAALWLEREVWDMYGIHFSGHPDLRRILTDYGLRGASATQGLPADRPCRDAL